MRNALAALALLAVLAALITGSIRYGLGRLPGDIVVQRENFSFYFPLATAILVSIALSLGCSAASGACASALSSTTRCRRATDMS